MLMFSESRGDREANDRSGVVVRGLQYDTFDGENARKTLDNVKHEQGVEELNTAESIQYRLSGGGDVPIADIPSDEKSYFNPVGGWAWAAKAVERLYEGIIPLGGKIIANAELAELIIEDGDVKGVKTVDGREFRAEKVVVCTGSWTAAHPALAGLIPQGLITATGQTIAAVQLDDEERKRYKDIPIAFNYGNGSGWYSFPVSVISRHER
jgi:sarcosine oxidase/L-pipecolate oxidase